MRSHTLCTVSHGSSSPGGEQSLLDYDIQCTSLQGKPPEANVVNLEPAQVTAGSPQTCRSHTECGSILRASGEESQVSTGALLEDVRPQGRPKHEISRPIAGPYEVGGGVRVDWPSGNTPESRDVTTEPSSTGLQRPKVHQNDLAWKRL